MAKLTASEMSAFVTLGGSADTGRLGLRRGSIPVEQWMRDAKLEEIEEGTSDIMRLIISRKPSMRPLAGRRRPPAADGAAHRWHRPA